MKEQDKINWNDKKQVRAYMKDYRKAYNQKPEVKAHRREYEKTRRKEFLSIPNCKGMATRVYTNGVTEELKKKLPEMMDEVALKLLREK